MGAEDANAAPPTRNAAFLYTLALSGAGQAQTAVRDTERCHAGARLLRMASLEEEGCSVGLCHIVASFC